MKKNARLEKLFTLSHKITVFVPATKNDAEGSHPINNNGYVEQIASIMSESFGGATSTDAIGYWMSPERGLEKENTKLVFSYAENLDNIDNTLDWCEWLKTELNQDAIAIEIDNQMYFI